MTLLITVIVVLLLAVSALLFFPWAGRSAADRDALNRAFYRSRLRELEEEKIPGREEMVVELQQSLLADIPDQQPAKHRPFGRRALLPGVLLLAVVSIGAFIKTSSLSHVLEWQQVTQQTPALIQRVMDPDAKPLSMEEMARLGLGLRTRLQDDPQNAEGWLMLGRIGMVLNNASTATQAFERAWRLAPDNLDAKLDYAEVLTRSSDPQDNQQGEALLRDVLSKQHANIRALSLLAFSAFEQQRYKEAIGAWQILLRLLPADDERRTVVARSIAQAKVESGMDNARVAVKITLSPQAEKALPEKGIVFVSVTDGVSNVPVAAKKLPLGHFPLTLTLDDTNAMMPDRLLSSVRQGIIKVHISQAGTPAPQTGDWTGQSGLIQFNPSTPVEVEVSQPLP